MTEDEAAGETRINVNFDAEHISEVLYKFNLFLMHSGFTGIEAVKAVYEKPDWRPSPQDVDAAVTLPYSDIAG